MTRTARAPAPAKGHLPAAKSSTLDRQQNDFTSEGAPPPASTAPAAPGVTDKPAAAAAAPSPRDVAGRLALAALLAAPLSPAMANLILNDSFEADAQSAGTWSQRQNLSGWTGGQYGIELRHNVAGAAYDGVNFVELDTTHNSQMLQQIATSLGEQYTLTFAHAAREGVARASNGIEVLWNGVSQGVYTGDGARGGNAWTIESLVLTGAADVSTLIFRAVGRDDSYGSSLDAVSLTRTVPEPGILVLLLAGLGAAGVIVRRRQS